MVSVKLHGPTPTNRSNNHTNHNHYNIWYNYFYYFCNCCRSNNNTVTTSNGNYHHHNNISLQHVHHHQQRPHHHRCLVLILLITFVFITIFIPILRFIHYDDSHLFQSFLVLDHPYTYTYTNNDGTSISSTSSGTSTLTLMDVALGKVPLSDYIQQSSSSSSSLQVPNTVTTTSKLSTPSKENHKHNDIPVASKKLRQTTHQNHVEDTEQSDTTSNDDNQQQEQQNEENEHESNNNEIANTDSNVDHDMDSEELLTSTTTKSISFSLNDEIKFANQYLQTIKIIGRNTNTIIQENDTNSKKQGKRKKKSIEKNETILSSPLLFFHIPKTAGTAIEYAAGIITPSLSWGSCRFNHLPKRTICHYPKNSKPWPQYVGWWHIPVQLFPIANSNPYQNKELFGVIRNPYDRMVSEFYYICTLKVFDWRPDQCNRNMLSNKSYMNEWLSKKIRNHETDSGRSYLIDNGHFTPQYDYIFGPHQVRMLDYVLFMDQDNFNDQFHTLMDAYDLPNVRLKKINALGASARTEDHLDVSHLDTTTLQWIHNMYPDDFAPLGYEKMSQQ